MIVVADPKQVQAIQVAFARETPNPSFKRTRLRRSA